MTKQKRIKRLASCTLSRIKTRAGKLKNYKDIQCLVTKADLELFYTKNWSRYLYLHRQWVKNGRIVKYRISIDRIDSKKHYSMDNIRLLPTYLNSRYARKGTTMPEEAKKIIREKSRLFFTEKGEEYFATRFKESRERMKIILERNRNGEKASVLAKEFNITEEYIYFSKRKLRESQLTK